MVDAYAIELIRPAREGRLAGQIGENGKSNYRWIVGGKLCLALNHLGLVVDWDCDTANVHDIRFNRLVERFADRMVALSDLGFHSAKGDPSNIKICRLSQS